MNNFKTRKPTKKEYELLKLTTQSNIPAHTKLILLCGTVFCVFTTITMLLQHKSIKTAILPIAALFITYAIYFAQYFANKLIRQKRLAQENVHVVKAVCTKKKRSRHNSGGASYNHHVSQTQYTFTTEFGDVFQKTDPLTFGVITEQTQCIVAKFGESKKICIISID